MRVDATSSPRAAAGRSRSRFPLIVKILAAGVALAAYSAALILFGMAVYRSLQADPSASGSRLSVRAIPKRLASAAKNHVAAFRANDSFDRLHLDIKFKHLEKLRAKRNEAIDKGVLMASNDDFVPATIRHDGRSIKARIRLKGDAIDHLLGDKWSFRVKVRKNDQLFGMRRFSIQAPAVRDFQAEPIFLSHLKREGILTPRYRFVDVAINGKDIGVMAVEEHFSKELLESQRRREGVILRFDENGFWQNFSLNGTFGPYGNPHVSILKPFRASKIAESPALQTDFATAVGLLRGLLAGKLAPTDVFDMTLMARFMAVCEVWRTHHPLAWHNMRFYYNPLTARLEPVGFDGNVQAVIHEPGLVATRGGFTPYLLADDEFKAIFIAELARIAGDMADGSITDWARPIENELVPLLQEGLQHIEPMRFDALSQRAQSLATIDAERFDHFVSPLGDPDMKYPEPIMAYVCGNCATPRMELVNILPVPVVVHSIEVSRRSGVGADATIPLIRSAFPIEIPATKAFQRPTSVFIEIDSADDLDQFKVDLEVQVNAQTEHNTVRASAYYDLLSVNPLPAASLEEALGAHPFLRIGDDQSGLVVDSGSWEVTSPLIIPADMALTLSPGTELLFDEGGILVATGPLHFHGTEEAPIRLAPRAGAGTWGGLVSLRSNAPFEWRHVVVERTSGFQRTGWRLTGGTTLRKAEVKIAHSRFVGNRAEDALNLIRTRFELEDVEFEDTSSDALDADFSDGVIRGGRFSQIGGDGIDVSGAKIEVDGTILEDIDDKAISVGEASRLIARNVRIVRVGTGVASKDASEFIFEDSSIEEASTAGVSVYTKKPVYGPASATLLRIDMKNVATDVLVQSGNRATVDGTLVAEQPFDANMLY